MRSLSEPEEGWVLDTGGPWGRLEALLGSLPSSLQLQQAACTLGATAWNGKNRPQTFPNISPRSTQSRQTALVTCSFVGTSVCSKVPLPEGHRAPGGWSLCRGSGAWPHFTRKGPWALSSGCISYGISTKRI